MKARWPLGILLTVLMVAGGLQVRAAEPARPESAAPSANSPGSSAVPGIFAPKIGKAPARPSEPSRRALSPEMAAKLGGVVNQAVAALPPPPPRAETADDADVVRMDPFRVEEKEAPEFKERDLRKKKAFDDMAKTLGGSALGGPGVAAAAGDSLERARGREAKELIDLTRIGGSVPPGMKKVVDEMNTRVNDPRAQNGTPFREPQINNRF